MCFLLISCDQAADDLLPDQIQEPLEPTVINDNEKWEVEQVLDSCLHYRKLQYHVKWIGYDEDWTWYPVLNFIGSPHWLQAFHVGYPDQPGPLQRLENWLQAWENSEDDVDDHLDNEYTQDWGQPWFKEGGYVMVMFRFLLTT